MLSNAVSSCCDSSCRDKNFNQTKFKKKSNLDKMPESIKHFTNRCRCCLEKFYHDEEINTITNFFKSQYNSFTRLELQESDLLSRHVCEFCHSELLRFSGFKKDLIEKQQKLNELLKQHNERNAKTKQRSLSFNDDHMVLENGEIKTEILEETLEEEEEMSESIESVTPSDDEKDQDFLIVRANERQKLNPPVENKAKVTPAAISSTFLFTCDFCYKKFKAKQGLTRHVQSHIENSTPWKCGELDCDFAASSKIKLNSHKKEMHGIEAAEKLEDGSKKIKTEKIKKEKVVGHNCFCGANFQNAVSLRAHKNRVHGSLNKCIYGCENVQYIKTGHWIRHVQNRHPDKLEEVLKKISASKSSDSLGEFKLNFYHCDKCNFKALKKSSMKSHLESHLPDSVRQKFECDICLKKFTRPTSLRVHRETVHDMIRKFKCPKCPEVSFKQAGHLNDHVASKHGKNRTKSFRCNSCPKVFLKRYMLNRHQQVAHKAQLVPMLSRPVASKKKTSADKKVKCFCGKEFPYQSRLVRHQLKHDENGDGAKQYICKALGCTHSFTARCNLIRHQKQKGHLPANELKRLKFVCLCGERFFSYRGYSYHCDKTKCKKKKKSAKFAAAQND